MSINKRAALQANEGFAPGFRCVCTALWVVFLFILVCGVRIALLLFVSTSQKHFHLHAYFIRVVGFRVKVVGEAETCSPIYPA